MVICHSSRFVYIRIPKNASTSLATFFIRGYCGADDAYTQVNDSGIASRNFPQHVYQKYRDGHRFIHLTLNDLLESKLITEDQARSYKVVGCVREPFDRQLSLYFFRRKIAGNAAASPEHFRECFVNGYHEKDLNNRIRQCEYLTIGDETVGEYWLYENLNNHLAAFSEDRKPKQNVALPTYKSRQRTSLDKERLIDEYYDQATKDAVLRYYEKDFELYESLKQKYLDS